MKIRSSHLLPLAALCGLSVIVAAAPPQQRRMYLMTGSAEAPKNVSPDSLLTYSLTETPTIPPAIGRSKQQQIECLLRPLALRSLRGRTVKIGRRGISPDGTLTWDIAGKCAGASGIYCDEWQIYDNLLRTNPRKNAPLKFTQTVVISGPQAGSPPQNIAPEAGFNLTPIRPEDKSQRENLSDALKPQLLKRLTPALKTALKNGGEVPIRIDSLPAPLRRQAEIYIDISRHASPFNTDSKSALDAKARAEMAQYSVVLLPPPSMALGVDTYADKPEQAHHF